MKWLAWLAVLGMAGLLSAGDSADKAAQEDLKKLEGTWNYVSVDLAGKKLPDDIVSTGTLTIKGNTYTTKLFGQVTDEGTFKVDPTKKPKTWDKVSNKIKDAKIAGVYQLDGDMLKYCESPAGMERPKDIDSKKGTLDSTATLKRKK
jgi:uncharacterized protein (TIGR03067 family)